MLAKAINSRVGDVVKVVNKWAAECEARGTTLSSSSWTTSSGSLAGAALSGTTASALLSVAGVGQVTNTITMANGEILTSVREVCV